MALLTPGSLEEIWTSHKRELEEKLSGRITDSGIETSGYATNAGNFELAPVAVVAPENVSDVTEVVRFCRRHGLTITARGAGSSVTDASLGRGIVIDFSRKMNTILALDLANNLVTVGAGITLEALNTELKKYGKMVPIFPVKGWKCTVGGCIATDAGGFLSTCFGRMHDLVVSIDAVNSEGRNTEYRRSGNTVQHPGMDLLRERILPMLKEEGTRFAGTCGYRLGALRNEEVDYVELMVGSEGSLALFTAATLRVTDRIGGCAASLLSFGSAGDALDFALRIREESICAELMDSTVLSACRRLYPVLETPRGSRFHLLVIWREGKTGGGAQGNHGPLAAQEIEGEMEEILGMLKDALHVLQRQTPEGRYVVAAEGVEVQPRALPGLVMALEEISRRYALKFITFGHAAEGIIYARPFLDLRKSDDRQRLASFLRELATALRAEGGVISSENGLGSQLLPYAKYCLEPERQAAFDILKKNFDPANLLGNAMRQDEGNARPYRFGPEHYRKPFKPILNWNIPDSVTKTDDRPLSMIDEMDACHGCGECRTLSYIETQCPVYKTMGSELTSPRGMDNMVRVLSNVGGIQTVAMHSSDYMRSLFDYCIQCKMCLVECPSHVNTPKIMMEARAQHVKQLGPGIVARATKFFADYELYTVVASSVARLSNRLLNSVIARSALEHALGIDRRRRIPPFDSETFSEWFTGHLGRPGKKGQVAYFADVYSNYFDSRVGKAVVRLLEKAGYSTLFPKQRFTGLPLIHMGLLREAKRYLLENVSYLYPYTARGMPVVCSSPSAVMAMRVDYPSVVDDERSRALARSVVDVHEFLCSAIDADGAEMNFGPVAPRILYHPSCHSRALGTDRRVLQLLRRIPGAEVEELQAGCCGAGGSYGFARETFNLSMEIGRNVFREAARGVAEGAVLVTDGEECALQIEQATGKHAELTLLMLARSAGIMLEKTAVAADR